MYRFLIPGLLLFFLLAICLSIQSQAQDQNSSTQNVTEIEVPEPKVFTTRHEGTFGEVRQYYTVKAAETYLFNEKNQPYGSIWSVSYTLDEVQDKAERPVIFIFNGGPGSASVWLHMGLFGPVLVA
jgi:carboxypeptidase C (cathepsin A)